MAEQTISFLLTKEPRFKPALFLDAILAEMKDDWQGSLSKWMYILSLYPSSVKAIIRISNSYVKLGDYQNAIEILDKHKVNLNDHRIFKKLGRIFGIIGDTSLSILNYKKAIERVNVLILNKARPALSLYRIKIELLIASEQISQALSLLEEIKENFDTQKEFILLLEADVLASLNICNKACEKYKEYLIMDPYNHTVQGALGKCYEKLSDRVMPNNSDSILNQPSNFTCLDRYPYLFGPLSKLNTYDRTVNILSFGCSMGSECQSLLDYFGDNVDIVGVDISYPILEVAKAINQHNNIKYYHVSKLPDMKFDYVFAMSVLCYYPDSKNVENLSTLYSFKKFEDTLMYIHSYVKINGYLVLYNANYRVEDSIIYDHYTDVELDAEILPESVPKFRPSGHRDDNLKVTNVYKKIS